MKLFANFSLLVRSSLTSLRDKVEDPERMLHQLVLDMQDELERVRLTVADTVADEIQLRRKADKERQTAEDWLQKATSALQKKKESLAESALQQKAAADERAVRYETELKKQSVEVRRLRESVTDLEDRIRQAKQRKSLLAARLARAETTQKINSALDRTTRESAFAQFERFEERVERTEALTEAMEVMDGIDLTERELQREFEEDERTEAVARQLAELKRKLSSEED